MRRVSASGAACSAATVSSPWCWSAWWSASRSTAGCCPSLGEYLNHRYGWFIPYAGEFHSFGLIIISLTANQFWKTGLVRGLLVLAVTLGVTYLIVRYGLMEFTNFRISNLNYLYEDVATSILASPKAYIILLTTAFLASRMNLKYGLDYSGILIPALVALQWYQPTKIITTVAEAVIIYGIGMLVLRLPVFARTTIEGARKLLLFFNISFAYKLALGLPAAVAGAVAESDRLFRLRLSARHVAGDEDA